MKKSFTSLACILAIFTSIQAQVPSAGKILHLEFDSNDPQGLLHDLSGNNANATITGSSPISAMGVSGSGNAIQFNGNTSLVYPNGIYNQPNSPNNTDYTFSTMIQVTQGAVGIFGQGYSLNNQCNSLKITNNNQITNYWYANDFAFNHSTSLVNVWHHITISYNSTSQTRKIYVDGVNTITSTQAVTVNPNWTANAPFNIGRTVVNEYLYGIMDNFIGYNRALSDAEVMQLYNYSNCTGTATAVQNNIDFHSIDLTVNGMANPLQIEVVSANALNFTQTTSILTGNTINISNLDYTTHYIKITDANGCITRTSIVLSRPYTCTDDVFISNNNLIFHLPFNGNANDVSASSAAPSVNTGMLVDDKCGNANSAYLLANGELKYDLDTYPQLMAGTNGKLTITCWINNIATFFNSTYPTFVEIGDAAYLRYGAGSFFNAGVHNANTLPGTYGYSDKVASSIPVHDQWHFYAFVYDMNINGSQGAIKVYIDSTEFYSGGNVNLLNLPVDYSIVGSTNHYLSIGGGAASGASKKFYGAIDNVMIFNEALSSSQLNDIRYGNEIQAVGINKISNTTGTMELYPNPSNDLINIDLSSIEIEIQNPCIQILNALGEVILKESIIKKITTFDVSKLEQGIYIVQVKGSNFTNTKKFVKSN